MQEKFRIGKLEVMIFTLVVLFTMAAALPAMAGTSVHYQNPQIDDEDVAFAEDTWETHAVVDDNTTAWNTGWYVVSGAVRVYNRITVNISSSLTAISLPKAVSVQKILVMADNTNEIDCPIG